MNKQNTATKATFKSTNLLNAHHSLHQDIFSTDNHLMGSFKNQLLTGSSQANSLVFEDNFLDDFNNPNPQFTTQSLDDESTEANTVSDLDGFYDGFSNPQEASEYSSSSTMPIQGTVTGGSEEGILLNSELQDNPSIRNIGFKEFSNPVDAEQTWVIVHGWNDAPEGRFIDLAQEIATANSSDRVLLLDWSEAAYNSSEILGIDYGAPGDGNFRAATWVSPVAEFAVKALNDFYGIDQTVASQSLNLIGHSLGSLVNAEMGKIYRDGLTIENETVLAGNNEGTRTITALEPPSARNGDDNPFAVDQNEGIYDIDGRINGIQAAETFADVSVFSRAFVGEKSIAGNKELAVGADEAFEMDFGSESEWTDFGSEHDRVIRAFTNTINQQDLLGDLLGSKAYESLETIAINDLGEIQILEGSDKGFKGIIDVSEENIVTSLTGILKSGNQDDIVIGSYGNEEMHGTDLLDFGGDSLYKGEHNDIFFGESGNDIITGNDNDDILIGGIGKDILNGGTGIDTFVFNAGDGAALVSETNLIEDFEVGIDKIGLTNMNFEELTFQQSSDGTAIISGSEIIALLKNTTVEQIQNPESFVSVTEDAYRIS